MKYVTYVFPYCGLPANTGDWANCATVYCPFAVFNNLISKQNLSVFLFQFSGYCMPTHHTDFHFFRFSLSFLRLFLRCLTFKFFGYLNDFLTQHCHFSRLFFQFIKKCGGFFSENDGTTALQSGYSLRLLLRN